MKQVHHNMRKGLGFFGRDNGQHTAMFNQPEQRERNTGKMVLNDFCATPELFEMVCVSSTGMDGTMRIKLRSLKNRSEIEVDSFRKVRPARSNELKANARQGSDEFDQYWQHHGQQHYY